MKIFYVHISVVFSSYASSSYVSCSYATSCPYDKLREWWRGRGGEVCVERMGMPGDT